MWAGELPGFGLLPEVSRGEGGDAKVLEMCGGPCGITQDEEVHSASYPQPCHHVGLAEPQAAGDYRAHQH